MYTIRLRKEVKLFPSGCKYKHKKKKREKQKETHIKSFIHTFIYLHLTPKASIMENPNI